MTSLLQKSSNKEIMYSFSSWDDETLNLKQKLLRGIYAFGFEKPSSIQKKALYPLTYRPPVDIIAQAQSGTGKTGAFVTGTLQIINEKHNNTQAIILAPTHELAIQTKQVLDDIGRFLKVKSQLLVGGSSVEKDKKLLLCKRLENVFFKLDQIVNVCFMNEKQDTLPSAAINLLINLMIQQQRRH